MNNSEQITTFLIVAVLILAAAPIPALAVFAGGTATISLADFDTNPVSTIKVPLMIYNVTAVVGGELNISFDPSVVHLTDISDGDIGTTTANINNDAGWAYMNVFGTEGKSGDVVFANLNLTAVGSEGDKSPLNISVISLFDTNYMDIPYNTDNGTFAIRDITPHASISNLQNITGTTWINWTWTNPTDDDFNYTMVYLNGAWQTNTSFNYYKATGLNPDTSYEIGTHTVDTYGNVNTTWINQTAKTAAASSDTSPPIVTNPNATLYLIPDDTDNDPRWGETSQLNVTITDDSGILSVTINLSQIGGSSVQPMTNIGGNIWSVTTNASANTARWNGTAYEPYCLQVNATDFYGNSNTSVSIELIVMKNGDVTSDGIVDFGNGIRLINHDFYPEDPTYSLPSDTIADVTGDGIVDFGDGIRIINHDNYPEDPSYILK